MRFALLALSAVAVAAVPLEGANAAALQCDSTSCINSIPAITCAVGVLLDPSGAAQCIDTMTAQACACVHCVPAAAPFAGTLCPSGGDGSGGAM